MALFLKRPSSCSGLIVLNQKEDRILPLLSAYRSRYVVGCHVGCYFRESGWPSSLIDSFDFYMASRKQLSDDFPSRKLIELNSRNFLPVGFHPSNGKSIDSLRRSINALTGCSPSGIYDRIPSALEAAERQQSRPWDVLWINKPHPVKRPQQFVTALRQAFNVKPLRTLVVCAVSPNERRWPHEFFDIESAIRGSFSSDELRYFTLLRPSTDGNEGADNSLIPPFYQWSKVFAFFTEREGESRVVAEALCCGCSVVSYFHVVGEVTTILMTLTQCDSTLTLVRHLCCLQLLILIKTGLGTL